MAVGALGTYKDGLQGEPSGEASASGHSEAPAGIGAARGLQQGAPWGSPGLERSRLFLSNGNIVYATDGI